MISQAISKPSLGVVANAVLLGVTLMSVAAQAEVTWNIVGTASGEPDLAGTANTPDVPVTCSFGPPAGCPISGTLTIPAGALGGPGTTIDLGADPANVIVNIATSPPTVADNFFLLTISKDGYTCNSSNSFVLQCDFDNATASYDLALTEQVPRVAIGNGNITITGQLHVAGQIIAPLEPTIYSIGDTGPAGGIVFYVTDAGLHGLEAAPIDQSTGIQWGCWGRNLFGAHRRGLERGYANTLDILDDCLDRPIAASVASDYLGPLGNTRNWFLPSDDELNLMYQNLHLAGLGGFANDGYWSSKERDLESANVRVFTSGVAGSAEKNSSAGHVRAIRAF